MPATSAADAATDAARELTAALLNPAPASPFPALGTEQMAAIKQLAAIFTDATTPATAPQVTPTKPSKYTCTTRQQPRQLPGSTEIFEGRVENKTGVPPPQTARPIRKPTTPVKHAYPTRQQPRRLPNGSEMFDWRVDNKMRSYHLHRPELSAYATETNGQKQC